MRKLAIGLAIVGLAMSNAGVAQANVDMARITCAEYLAMSPADSAVFSAWISGWFNQKKGYAWINTDAFARNVASVKAWCTGNPTQSVMAGLERSTAGQ
jgi:acid stress chaperone HdeB